MSKYAIDRYKEALETTADEFNIPIITKEEIGKRIDDEIAESVWRDTVLNPDYKSPFNEEE